MYKYITPKYFISNSASSGTLFEKKHCCLETKNSCNIDFKQFQFSFKRI